MTAAEKPKLNETDEDYFTLHMFILPYLHTCLWWALFYILHNCTSFFAYMSLEISQRVVFILVILWDQRMRHVTFQASEQPTSEVSLAPAWFKSPQLFCIVILSVSLIFPLTHQCWRSWFPGRPGPPCSCWVVWHFSCPSPGDTRTLQPTPAHRWWGSLKPMAPMRWVCWTCSRRCWGSQQPSPTLSHPPYNTHTHTYIICMKLYILSWHST